MNLEKEKQLLCWGCMMKHPRSSFLPADDRTPGVEMCRVTAKPEERICRFKFADLVFVDTRTDPNQYNKAFLDAHWEDLGRRKKGQKNLTTEILKRITANGGCSRRSKDKVLIVEDTMDICMLCKLPWIAGKCGSKAGCVPERRQPDGKRCKLCPSSKIRVPRFWTRTPDQEWVENPMDRPKVKGVCFQYGSNLNQLIEDKFESVFVAVYDNTGKEKRGAARNWHVKYAHEYTRASLQGVCREEKRFLFKKRKRFYEEEIPDCTWPARGYDGKPLRRSHLSR
jgi:hypothetical protein